MYRPEVWMSAAATPRARSAAVTRRTAWFACCSADATDAPLTWTPMLSVSWFGVPVTVPLPVTVIRPDLTAATSVAPPRAGPADVAPPPRLAPKVNAPINSAAAAVPTAAARTAGVMVIVTAQLRSGESCRFDASNPAPGSPDATPVSRAKRGAGVGGGGGRGGW